MTPDDAIPKMDLLGHGFFFINKDTNRSAVIYKLDDGDIDWSTKPADLAEADTPGIGVFRRIWGDPGPAEGRRTRLQSDRHDGIFSRVLRSGEGQAEVRRRSCPTSTPVPELQALSDDALRARRANSASASTMARSPTIF